MGAFFGNVASTLIGEALKNKITGYEPLEQPGGKGLLQSKTAYGVAVMLLPTVGRWFGFEFDDASAQEIVNQVVVLVGGLLALYGRVKASKPIGKRSG